MAKKVVGIQEKPVVDMDELDRLAKEAELKDDPKEQEPEAEAKPVEPPAPVKPVIDYEQKFKDSQREAMMLAEQIKKNEEEKMKKIEITEDFLVKKYPDWEDMTTGEQRAIKRTEELEQQVSEIKAKTNQFNNDRAWAEKVDTYAQEELLDNFPQLSGREEEFKRFATGKTHKGLPLDVIAKVFTVDNPAPLKKKDLFHASGSSAAPSPTESGELSADESERLMRANPGQWLSVMRQQRLKGKK